MRYFEIEFTITPNSEINRDILNALLADIGFESFVEYDNGVKAYIQETLYEEEVLKEVIDNFPFEETKIEYNLQLMEDKNWNEEWEKNFFQPLFIEDKCIIHSTFHTDIPQREYDIIINPQMAFGTGHHETTSLIIEELLQTELKGKTVLDMGCGTSILAILASMKRAESVTAIDIDTWCVENSKDNIELNHITNIKVELGDADSLKNKGPFDIVIANINRNILLNDMKKYVACMKKCASLYISGFYTEDIPLLKEEAIKLNMEYIYHKEKKNWAMIKLILK